MIFLFFALSGADIAIYAAGTNAGTCITAILPVLLCHYIAKKGTQKPSAWRSLCSYKDSASLTIIMLAHAQRLYCWRMLSAYNAGARSAPIMMVRAPHL